MMNIKNYIDECLTVRLKSKPYLIKDSSTMVGATLYDKHGNTYSGFNIQNRSHKSYHAEEMAVLNAILQGANMKDMVGMLVSFSSTIEKLTFCCGHCRQIMWEYILNPDLLVSEIGLDGTIIETRKLSDLYPCPYPR